MIQKTIKRRCVKNDMLSRDIQASICKRSDEYSWKKLERVGMETSIGGIYNLDRSDHL